MKDDNNPMTAQQEAEAIKAAQREYSREYRARNRDKVKQWNKNFWLKRAQRAAQEGEGQDGTQSTTR